MYTFFLVLISINMLFFLRFSSLTKFFNLYDKKTNVAVIGGLFLYFNFFLLATLFLFDQKNIIFDDYFMNFFIDQSSISYREVLFFFLLPTLFFIMGIYDDKYDLNANYRIIASFFIIFVFLLIDENFIIETIRYTDDVELNLYRLSMLFTAICVTGLIFAFNMYDGINLQFGIHLLIIFIFFIMQGILENFFLIFALLILVFLYLNFKNKTYMGDSGAYFTGALVSIIFLKNYNIGVLKVEEIIIVSLIPILDMFRVIITRIFLGSHPFKKDNIHLHHILKHRYKKKYLWQIGSYLTLFNIFLLTNIKNVSLVLSISILIYISLIIYLSLSKKSR